jgi:hypothetical protein
VGVAEQQLLVDERILAEETDTTLEKVISLLSDKGIYPNEVQNRCYFLM